MTGTRIKLGLLALAAGMGLAGCGGGKPAASAGAGGGAAGGMQAMPVQVEAAKTAPVKETSSYVGAIQSLNSTVISPLVGGIIRKIEVASGDQVKAGQALVQIDPALQQATVQNLENSQAALASTLSYDQQQLKRAQALYEEKIGTLEAYQSAQSTYNTARAQINSLEAQIRQAKVTLSYYTVTAPRAGVVGDIPVRVGDQVTTGTKLTTLDSPSGMQVYVQVPITDAGRLRPGLPLQVTDSQGHPIANTRINFISPQVDNQTQTILVKGNISHPSQPVRTMEYVQATITWGQHLSFLAPVLSVLHEGGRDFLFVAAPRGKGYYAHQIPIQTGPIQGNDVEVTSGLQAGEQVIVSTVQMLAEGMPVMPMPAGSGAGSAGAAGPAGPGAQR